MSEYQYYEFQALDRRLTSAEMAELQALSKRAQITPTSASYVYHFGDFRGDVETILDRYFDVMLYIANWGSRRLMFRFPKAAISLSVLEAYCIPYAIEVKTTANHILLDISINEEQGGEWLEEDDGRLTAMIGLRDAILRGDYRVLYLAWLRAASLELAAEYNLDSDRDYSDDDSDDDTDRVVTLKTPEPPLPPNLKGLDAQLSAFVTFIKLDPVWLEVSAAASPDSTQPEDNLEQWILSLSEAESRAYLLYLTKGDASVNQVVTELRQRFTTPSRAKPPKSRTLGTLLAAVKRERQRLAEDKRKTAEAARVKRLQSITAHESELWAKVNDYIVRQGSASYGDAVKLLCELRDAANYAGTQASFAARLTGLRQQFASRHSLISKMRSARLIE